ncbi:MAG: hypothetical protein ACKOSO_01825, partial [Actinomycetota bacterium]
MGAAEETHDEAGTGAPARVRLRFAPSDVDVKVPGGVTVFDAALLAGAVAASPRATCPSPSSTAAPSPPTSCAVIRQA